MDDNKEYYAFISYKREDEKWAKWLQHQLEHYHLPTKVRKENPSLPQNIRPVFKDTSELAAGVLADEILDALENSKNLIVICSPRAAQSQWVGKEIQTFIDIGRADKIIPFIIGGQPFSEKQEEECFHSALLNLPKEKELIGVNINEMGRDAAAVKVVARMFGLKFDTLWQRYEREQRRKRWMWIGGSILIALLGLIIGGYFVRQNGIIEKQNERLQQDSLTMAKHLHRISAQMDSIDSQNSLILSQRDSIDRSIQQLQLSNNLLAEERDNVKNANYSMRVNLSRVLAEKALFLVDEGDSYRARKVAVAALKTAYTPEAERVLRLSSKYNTYILKEFTDYVNSISFSKDGRKIMAASANGIVNVWNCETSWLEKTIYEDKFTFDPVYSVEFNKDASKILCLSFKGVSVRDINTDNRLSIVDDKKKRPICAIYSPIEEVVAIVNEDEIILYNACSGNMVNSFSRTPDASLHKSHDILQEIGERKVLSFSPDGKCLAEVSGNRLIVHDLSNGKPIKEFNNKEGRLFSVAYDRSGERLVSVGEKGRIYVWNVSNGRKTTYIDTTLVSPNYALFCPNEKSLAVHSELAGIHLLDMTSGNVVMSFDGHCCSFGPNGDCIATGSSNGNIFIHDIIEHRGCHVWRSSSEFISIFEGSPDDENVAIAKGNDVLLIKYGSGMVSDTFKCSDEVKGIQFSPDGRRLAAITKNKVLEWDLISKEMIQASSDDNRKNDPVALHYYTQRRASIFRGTITLENIVNGKKVFINTDYERTANTISCIVFNKDGNMLASCSKNGQIDIWDVGTGKHIKRLIGNINSGIKSIFFTNSNKYVVVKTWNKTYVFDFHRGLVVYDDFEDLVFYNEKYNQFLLRDWKTILRFDFPSIEKLIDDTEKRFQNNPLTAKERKQFFLE